MLTDRLSRFRFGSLRSLSPRRFRSESSNESTEIQSAPPIPACQMDYTVTGSDTLERIAAFHDCTVGELMKLNRMSSRMVFPGQKLIVPIPVSDDVFENANSSKGINNNTSTHEPPKKGPGHVVPAQKHALAKSGSAPVGSTDESDADCLQRFLKIKVKQVTESDGTVAGTLLVTPNCLMFDPDVSHPLVRENGQNLYGMVANMDEIVSVSVYKEIAALTGDRVEKKKDIFDPNHVRTPEETPAPVESTCSSDVPDDPVHEKVVFTCDHPDSDGYESAVEDANGGSSSKTGSDSFLPAITEESKGLDSPEETDRKRAVSDLTDSEGIMRRERSKSPSSSEEQRPRSFSELDTPSPNASINRFSPDAARRSFGKLSRTLSARARSVHQSVSQGTKTVAHGVVTHTKSAADSLQSGIETSVKVVGEAANAAANQAKAAADAVATVPSRMVDMGTSLVSDGINGVQEMFSLEIEEQKSPSQLKRDQSLATLEELRAKTQQARDESAKINKSLFACATTTDEMPDLFMPVDEMMKRNRTTSEAESPQLPYYMAVRLTRTKKKSRRSSPGAGNSVSSYDEEFTFGNKLKREFWFAIPRNKADSIYHFLLQWSPEKYGQDTTANSLDESALSTMNETNSGEEKGFLILDSNVDESLSRHSSLAPEHQQHGRERAHTAISSANTALSCARHHSPRLSCPDYMTQYDVKQLMKQQEFSRHNKDLPNDQSDEDKSVDPLESMHQQFSKNRTVEAKLSVRSNISDISVDSGLEVDHHGSTIELANLEESIATLLNNNHFYNDGYMENHQIPTIQIEHTPPTPTTPTTTNFPLDLPFNSAKQEKKKISRHFFSKKHQQRKLEERGRSRSLGAYTLNSEKPGPLFGASLLNREWELVTVSEICRRLSLDGGNLELPIPEGSDKSQILDEYMIRQLVEILPPRALGYPWVSIYNSEKHGFSLATLYRKMVEFDEDLSPVLLIIRDTEDHIFGAIVSGAIRPSDHFTGTGDSCQLWRFLGQAPNTRDLRPYQWTGENQFFVNATKEYLAIGAGSGHYGLWLDADLNHGRSQRCDTFDNELLAGDKEDFIVQFVEAFGFRM